MAERHRLLMTGAGGYLAGCVLQRLIKDNLEALVLVDPVFNYGGARHPTVRTLSVAAEREGTKLVVSNLDVRDPNLERLLREHRIDTVYHLAWIFNPLHNQTQEVSVNVDGSRNALLCAETAGVQTFVYPGSTTAYIDRHNTAEPIVEETAVKGTKRYAYSYCKAIVDRMCQEAMPSFATFVLIRGAIVIGPRTNNIVTKLAKLPVLPRVGRADPPIAFCSEEDMADVLYLSRKLRGRHIVNIAGDGTLRYSDLACMLGKKIVSVPVTILYPLVELGWRLRLMPFPSGILDLLRFPWVPDNQHMKELFAPFTDMLGYRLPRHTARDAAQQFLEGRAQRN